MTARWLPRPWLSAGLGLSWLLLQHTLAPVHLLAAVLIGVAIPLLVRGFLPAATPVRVLPAVKLALIVLWDIVVSNIVVARLVLGPMSRPQPAWVTVPLDLENPVGVWLLASIITTTPGTVSCSIDEERRHVLVHALNSSDPEQTARDIKSRYERRLMAIFRQDPHGTGASP